MSVLGSSSGPPGVRFLKKSIRGHGRLILCLVVLMLITSLFVSFAYKFRTTQILQEAFGKMFQGKEKRLKQDTCHFPFNDSSLGPIQAETSPVPGLREIEDLLGPTLYPGGHYVPSSCRSQTKVAIIIPYRDRNVHLRIFLRHIHPFLQRQNVEYGIYVIEQEGTGPFNRAMLMNIGFVEYAKSHNSDSNDCFIFHDVDLLPLDDRNVYRCSDNPLHLSASVDVHQYKLMYNTLFGGVSAMTHNMMVKVNGFSNVYFGWGAEDDDMSYRLRSHGMSIERYEPEVAKYKMLRHGKSDAPNREQLLRSSQDRIHNDGLNSLKYKRKDKQLFPLYTWILVALNQTEILKPFAL